LHAVRRPKRIVVREHAHVAQLYERGHALAIRLLSSRRSSSTRTIEFAAFSCVIRAAMGFLRRTNLLDTRVVHHHYSIGNFEWLFLVVRPADISYYYASRLNGDPPEGVEDLHFHPMEPRTLRGSVIWRL
jgi:hypothetical protein